MRKLTVILALPLLALLCAAYVPYGWLANNSETATVPDFNGFFQDGDLLYTWWEDSSGLIQDVYIVDTNNVVDVQQNDYGEWEITYEFNEPGTGTWFTFGQYQYRSNLHAYGPSVEIIGSFYGLNYAQQDVLMESYYDYVTANYLPDETD